MANNYTHSSQSYLLDLSELREKTVSQFVSQEAFQGTSKNANILPRSIGQGFSENR
mgnify:CR=1